MVLVAGFPIHLEWSGGPVTERSPIVLLHEGLGSVSAWGGFPAALADRTARPVLAYDRRGYGRSGPWPAPWPATFLEDEAADVLSPLLAGLGHPRPLLVGHSDGASIALAYPAHRRARAPLPVGPAPLPVGPAPLPLGIVSLSAHVMVEDVSVASIAALAGEREALVARLARHHDAPGELFDAWTEVWTSTRFRGWAMDRDLAAVRCPVLAVQGEEDRYGTRAQLDRLAAGVSGPVEVHELAGVDHWPHREATEVVLELVRDFCDRLDPPVSGRRG